VTNRPWLLALVSLAVLCGAGEVRSSGGYPARGADVLPEVALPGIDEHGTSTVVRTSDYFEPGTAPSKLLVVRLEGGAWCGTCRWHATHTKELLDHQEGRVRVLDVVLGNAYNDPATLSDAIAWRSALDVTQGVSVVIDPASSLRAAIPEGRLALPIILLVDRQSMTIRRTLGNPDPVTLGSALDAVLADLDHLAAPPPRSEALVDGVFHRNEWDMIRAIEVPGAPPPDASNEVADDSRAATLGKALFFDASLSPSGVACSSCHDPRHALSDARPVAMGVALGKRHTPRIALAAFAPRQFWDGRAPSLAAQALEPIEARDEMGSSRLFVAGRISERYRDAYTAVFPEQPLPDVTRLPHSGKPGDPAYDALDPSAKDAVTDVLTNVGKVLAAYERTFRVGASPVDAYSRGDFSALSFPEKQGLATFARMGCMQCHWGPRLTDDAFHVTRASTADPDLGRDERAAFKTPSLRGVSGAAFFGHRGAQATLNEVLSDYGNGAEPGVREPWIPRFGETTRWSIARFLTTLE
jgi:cytochrome c peroxidase